MPDTLTLILLAVPAVFLLRCISVLKENERGIVFRLGRLLPVLKGPGIVFVFHPVDRLFRVRLTPGDEMDLLELLTRLRHERSFEPGAVSSTLQEFADRVTRLLEGSGKQSR